MRTFFDTNVIAYMFDAGSTDKREAAQRLFEQEAEGGRAVLSVQVLQETYVTLTRKFETPLPPEQAETVIRNLSELHVVQADSRMVLAAIARSRKESLSFWDALIIEAALAAGCLRLLSEDLQDGRHFDGMTVENPFRAPAVSEAAAP
jgi:predicted nucleic acid-binding protein